MSIEVQNRTAFPYSAIALLIVTFPNGAKTAGTGALVGVNDVLTATHVLYNPDRGGWASKVEVYPGADFNGMTGQIEDKPYNIGSFEWQAKGWPVQVFSDGVATTFSSSESQYDVAVLGLSIPLGMQTGWFGLASGYDQAQWANVLGYSADASGMMSGTAWVIHDPSAALYLTSGSANADLLSFGSSGGPLYVSASDGTPTIIGVKSAGTSTSNLWADVGLLYDQVTAEIERNDVLITSPYLRRPVVDLDATVGKPFAFTPSSDTFKGGSPSASFIYSASLASGTPLPSWLTFNAATKTFSGTPSPGDQSTFNVRLTASSTNGTSISDDFLISVGPFGANIAGTSSNNELRGGTGNDVIDGGNGIDVLLADGPRANFSLSYEGNTLTLKQLAGNGGADSLLNIERIRFTDTSIALDIDGNAGQAYRLYQAAFNRTPDLAGLGFQMNAFDNGWPIVSIAQNFIDSPEFSRTYGSLDDRQFVTQLYANVLHRGPDSGGLAFHVNNLAGGMSRAQTLVGFSESPENQAALIGIMQPGMEFIPVT